MFMIDTCARNLYRVNCGRDLSAVVDRQECALRRTRLSNCQFAAILNFWGNSAQWTLDGQVKPFCTHRQCDHGCKQLLFIPFSAACQ
jgi:hypothetical protein